MTALILPAFIVKTSDENYYCAQYFGKVSRDAVYVGDDKAAKIMAIVASRFASLYLDSKARKERMARLSRINSCIGRAKGELEVARLELMCLSRDPDLFEYSYITNSLAYIKLQEESIQKRVKQ